MSHTLRIDGRASPRPGLIHRLVATGPSRALASLNMLVEVFFEAQKLAREAHRKRPFIED